MPSVSKQGFLLLLFLASLVAYATVVSYRSILSYDALNSGMADLVDASNYNYPSSQTNSQTLRAEKTVPKQSKKNAKQRLHTSDAYRLSKIRIRDFVPEDPPPEILTKAKKRAKNIDFSSIAKKWELPDVDASVELLKQIQTRTMGFDYNPNTDILALRHPLKTGGTSFSKMLKKIFPEQIVPGSMPSGWWNDKPFQQALKKHPIENQDDDYWTNMKALYTHTLLRSPSTVDSMLLNKLRNRVPALDQKRFRLMTNVRRPLDLAASSFYETQCRIGRFAGQRKLGSKECPPVNLTDVMYKNIDFWTQKCEDEKDWSSNKCQAIQNKGGETVFAHCGSIDYLLDDTENVHNMLYKSLMGDFPRPPELAYNDTDFMDLTPTLTDVSLYTLRDLGGLIDYSPVHKEDFVWFAITERFSESMCLFYYHFQVEPVEEKTSL